MQNCYVDFALSKTSHQQGFLFATYLKNISSRYITLGVKPPGALLKKNSWKTIYWEKMHAQVEWKQQTPSPKAMMALTEYSIAH